MSQLLLRVCEQILRRVGLPESPMREDFARNALDVHRFMETDVCERDDGKVEELRCRYKVDKPVEHDC